MNAPVKFRLAAIVMATAVTSIAVAPAALASAPMRQLSGLHDARYCEIIELKGAPPSATATVWNTIGLNKCPEAQWRAFNAVGLARELGDTFVVLDGPRYFLMDSVERRHGRRARIPRPTSEEGCNDRDSDRGRLEPDAVQGPDDLAHQHLALEQGAHSVRAGRARR